MVPFWLVVAAAAPNATRPPIIELGKLSKGVQPASVHLCTVGTYHIRVIGEDGVVVGGGRHGNGGGSKRGSANGGVASGRR